MAQKVTESVKGMDQGMETVAEVGLERAGSEVGKGLEAAFSDPLSAAGSPARRRLTKRSPIRRWSARSVLMIQRMPILWASMTWIPGS